MQAEINAAAIDQQVGVEQELEWKKVNIDRIWSFTKISLSSNQFLFNPYQQDTEIIQQGHSFHGYASTADQRQMIN